MQMLTNKIVWLTLLLFVASCSPLGHKKADRQSEPLSATLLPSHWENSGKLAIHLRNIDPASNIKPRHVLRYRWKQEYNDYRIRLSGNFGLGAVTITRQAGQVTLTQGKKVLGHAEDPDTLFYQHTGQRLPVSMLQYWIIGRPDPDRPAVLLDSKADNSEADDSSASTPPKLIYGFKQAGWTISYPKSSRPDDYRVPGKMIAEHEDIAITMIISGWKFDA